MNLLKENMMNLYGLSGENWIDHLPGTLEVLIKHWQLTQIMPVENMTYNYVVKAMSSLFEQPVILKVTYDRQLFCNEKNALIYFGGDACVKLIDAHEAYHALLLQQSIPGTSLKALYLHHEEFVITNYGNLVLRLHARSSPRNHIFPKIADWLKVLNRDFSEQLPADLLEKAYNLKEKLLASMTKQVVLHGDLHHDNILLNGKECLAIDPKGVVGEPEFEMAAFDFIQDDELSEENTINFKFEQRLEQLTKKVNLNPQRVKEWVFVRLVLGAVWNIEDHGYPGRFLKLVEIINDTIRGY